MLRTCCSALSPPTQRKRRSSGSEGIVKMHGIIGRDGKVRSLTLVSGPPLLASAAMSAVRDWRYIPAILNGQPIETEQDMSIDFRLQH